MLLGLVVTGSLVTYVYSVPGVYRSQVNVVLVQPTNVPVNDFDNSNESLIAMAGTVATLVNGPVSNQRSVSPGVSLTGEGIYHGYSIRVPNSGGQWDYKFDNPVLNIQATGSSAVEAESNMATALEKVRSALHDIQAGSGVAPSAMIDTILNPGDPQSFLDRGSRSRAVLATTVLALAVTVAAIIAFDRWSIERARGKAQRVRPLVPAQPH